jgi:hypothetical protein
MNHHLLDFGLTKNFQAGDRVRVQGEKRIAERDQLHALRLGQLTLTSNQATFMMLNNIDSSTGDEAARYSDRGRARDVSKRLIVNRN